MNKERRKKKRNIKRIEEKKNELMKMKNEENKNVLTRKRKMIEKMKLNKTGDTKKAKKIV